MFFEPNRGQAKKIQERIKCLYEDVGGEYYSGSKAWSYIKKKTSINLLKILKDLNV